jgi:hypothetical protein
MTNENLPELSYHYGLLGNARVAGEFFKEGDERHTQKALELILSDIDVKDPWIVRTVTDRDVLGKTIQNQLGTYGAYAQEENIDGFLGYHQETLKKILGDEKSNALKSKFSEEFGNRKYGDILKELGDAKYILEGENHGRNKDELDNAKKIIESYREIITAVSLLENYQANSFRGRVYDGVIKDEFNNLY